MLLLPVTADGFQFLKARRCYASLPGLALLARRSLLSLSGGEWAGVLHLKHVVALDIRLNHLVVVGVSVRIVRFLSLASSLDRKGV